MTQTVTCPKCGSTVAGGTDFGMVACNKCGEFIMIGASDHMDDIKAAVGPDHKPVEFEIHLADGSEKPALSLVPDLPPGLESPKTTILDINFDQLHKTGFTTKPFPAELEHEEGLRPVGGASSPTVFISPLPSMSRDSGPVDFSSPLDPIVATPGLGIEAQPESTSPLRPQETTHTSSHNTIPPMAGGSKPNITKPIASVFNDVADFANDQQPSTGTGGLVYNLQISGIDTTEMRQELISCLEDKRLQIDVIAAMRSIQAGVLTLPDLNPVKATVIVNNLKRLPFKIAWSSKQLIKGVLVLALLTALCAAFVPASRAYAESWARLEVNLKGYATRIENMQDDLRALIKKKNQEKDPKARDAILADIIKKNQELHRTYDDFKKEKEQMRFEHPEQGDETERKYHHVKLKSLDELENEAGIDGQLSRIKKKVEQTYPKEEQGAGDVETKGPEAD